jgi:hypothetical protein
MRKPIFCKDFCEDCRRHNITPMHFYQDPLVAYSADAAAIFPYAGFLFLSAALATDKDLTSPNV